MRSTALTSSQLSSQKNTEKKEELKCLKQQVPTYHLFIRRNILLVQCTSHHKVASKKKLCWRTSYLTRTIRSNFNRSYFETGGVYSLAYIWVCGRLVTVYVVSKDVASLILYNLFGVFPFWSSCAHIGRLNKLDTYFNFIFHISPLRIRFNEAIFKTQVRAAKMSASAKRATKNHMKNV